MNDQRRAVRVCERVTHFLPIRLFCPIVRRRRRYHSSESLPFAVGWICFIDARGSFVRPVAKVNHGQVILLLLTRTVGQICLKRHGEKWATRSLRSARPLAYSLRSALLAPSLAPLTHSWEGVTVRTSHECLTQMRQF